MPADSVVEKSVPAANIVDALSVVYTIIDISYAVQRQIISLVKSTSKTLYPAHFANSSCL